MRHSLNITIVLIVNFILSFGLLYSDEICQWETFNANCNSNSVIMMTYANYGRMKSGRCARNEHGHIGCQQDILQYMDGACSGKEHCTFSPAQLVVDGLHPCPVEVNSYLEANYKCVKVHHQATQQCIRNGPILIEDMSGYLKSYITDNNPIGSERCPLRIHMKPGLQLNFTLFDFGLWTSTQNSATNNVHQCHTSAKVREVVTGEETILCGGEQRVSHSYISRTNIVDVIFTGNAVEGERENMLLKYEAFGCEEITPQSGQHISISDGVATIICDTTDAVQKMRCVDNEWEGEMMECETDASGDIFSALVREDLGLTGMVVVLAVGVIIGCLTGMTCVICVLVCLHRNGCNLPCGLSPDSHAMSRVSKLPHKSHFDYQYSTAMNPHISHHGTLRQSNTVKRNEHVFIDPRTGLMYNTNSIKRSDVSGIRDIHNDCYQHTSVASATHIYDCPNYEVQSVQEDDDYVQETHTDSTHAGTLKSNACLDL